MLVGSAVAGGPTSIGITSRRLALVYAFIITLAGGVAGALASAGLGAAIVTAGTAAWATWSFPEGLPAFLLVGTAFLHLLTFLQAGFATRGDVIASPMVFLPALLAIWGPPCVRALLKARNEVHWRIPGARKCLVVGMAGLFVWLAIRWVNTPAPVYGTTKVLGFGAYSFMPVLLVLLFVRSSRGVARALRAMLILGGLWLAIVVTMAAMAGDLNLYRHDPGELFGSTNMAAGNLGAKAAMVALVALGIILCGRGDRPLAIICLTLGVAAAVLSGHRGSLAGLTAGAIVLWMASAVGRRSMLALITPIAIAGVALFIAWESAPDSIKDRYADVASSESVHRRAVDQAVALQAWLESPLIGEGTGASGFVIAEVDQPRFGVINGIYPHNVIIELLAETGLAGLVLYMLPLANLVLRAVRQFSEERWSLPILVALVVHAFVLSQTDGDLTLHSELWILLALLAAALDAARGEKLIQNAPSESASVKLVTR